MTEFDGGPDFARLLLRAREGNADARAALFDSLAAESRSGARFLGLVRRLMPAGNPRRGIRGDRVRDLVESRDVFQSALASGLVDLGGFEGRTRAEFEAWLAAIVRNKVGRTVRRWRPPGDPNAVAEPVDTESDPTLSILRDEDAGRLRSALETLPESLRSVVELRLRGLGAPEIARLMGIRADAVRKRESRAMSRLRDELRGRDPVVPQDDERVD